MNKKAAMIVAVFGFLIVILFCIVNYRMASKSISGLPDNESDLVIIIDPGHGGIDGGAVGINGAYEKDINLAVAFKLDEVLKTMGYTTIMTRTDDISLASSDAKTVRAQKTSDLHNRMEIMESYENVIFVSIHQNSYVGGKAAGTQVFYSPLFDESKILAESIQTAVREGLQPDNSRVIKEAGSSIYLLYKAARPAVMVECGFLSDEEENLKLCDAEYQNQLAYNIALGIKNYLD